MNAIDYRAPIFDEEVYAVRGNRARLFLGYSTDPDCIDKQLALGEGWTVERVPVVEPSILDEWTGSDPEVADYGSVSYETFGENERYGIPIFRKRRADVVDFDGVKVDEIECLIRTEHESNQAAAAQRVAWDEMQNRLAFRSPEVDREFESRTEHRGPDAGAGHSDVLSQQRRVRSDREFGHSIRRAANVLGDAADNQQLRFFAAMSDRERFRALVEAFGQDPDSDAIRAWKDTLIEVEWVADNGSTSTVRRARTYAECAALLEAKAEREGLAIAS